MLFLFLKEKIGMQSLLQSALTLWFFYSTATHRKLKCEIRPFQVRMECGIKYRFLGISKIIYGDFMYIITWHFSK